MAEREWQSTAWCVERQTVTAVFFSRPKHKLIVGRFLFGRGRCCTCRGTHRSAFLASFLPSFFCLLFVLSFSQRSATAFSLCFPLPCCFSVSCWAPACIGPYSQACCVGGGSESQQSQQSPLLLLVLLAGMIGLDPASMTLASQPRTQVKQCWTNLRQVLSVLR